MLRVLCFTLSCFTWSLKEIMLFAFLWLWSFHVVSSLTISGTFSNRTCRNVDVNALYWCLSSLKKVFISSFQRFFKNLR